jgi:hypothetical protein
MPRKSLIQIRRDTAANWTAANPILASGEMGFETDTGKFKIGDGATAWTSLLYATDASDVTGGTLTIRNTPTQDGVAIVGRSGGSSSYEVTLTPTTLTADRTLTLPDATGTAATVEPLISTSADLSGAGTYWRSPFVPYGQFAVSNAFATGAGISVPYLFNTPVVISEMGFQTSTTVSNSTTAKIVIYRAESTHNAPVTKVYEGSDLTVSGTNQQITSTGLSVSLSPGVYWFFVINTGASSLNLNVLASNLVGTVTNFVPYTSMSNALTQANTNGTWSVAFGSATIANTLLPFGAGSSATTSGANWPKFAIRRSS